MTDKKKILVVIDMQNDFIDGPLGTPEARGIVDKVCEKIRGDEWDFVYATMDTHFEDNYLNSKEGMKLPVKHCIQGTEGYYLNESIVAAVEENESACDILPLIKTTFGCTSLIDCLCRIFGSAPFVGNLYRTFTNMYEDIKNTEITLVGVCTDICVISNALLLKAHFPEMNIMVDAACCAGTSPEKHRMALEVMKSCQIDIVEE